MRADFARQIKTIRRFFFFLPHCFFAKINLGISTRFLRLENKVCRGCSLIGFPLKKRLFLRPLFRKDTKIQTHQKN